jgi:hypothetical protein
VKYTKAEVVFGFCDQDKEVIDKPTLAPPRRGIGLFALNFAGDNNSKSPPWRGFRGGSGFYKSENHFVSSIKILL